MRSIIIGLVGVLPFVASPVLAADAATQEANKKTVLEFYEAGLNKKDFDAAAKFFGPRYIQHNPTAPDGIEGFKGPSSASCGRNSRTRAARSSVPSPTATT
jgi:hypothetical protein